MLNKLRRIIEQTTLLCRTKLGTAEEDSRKYQKPVMFSFCPLDIYIYATYKNTR